MEMKVLCQTLGALLEVKAMVLITIDYWESRETILQVLEAEDRKANFCV